MNQQNHPAQVLGPLGINTYQNSQEWLNEPLSLEAAPGLNAEDEASCIMISNSQNPDNEKEPSVEITAPLQQHSVQISKETPTMVSILKELIEKTQRKRNKDSLVDLRRQHDLKTLGDQDFFNKVHHLDQSLTKKAFERVKEMKKQRSIAIDMAPNDKSQNLAIQGHPAPLQSK